MQASKRLNDGFDAFVQSLCQFQHTIGCLVTSRDFNVHFSPQPWKGKGLASSCHGEVAAVMESLKWRHWPNPSHPSSPCSATPLHTHCAFPTRSRLKYAENPDTAGSRGEQARRMLDPISMRYRSKRSTSARTAQSRSAIAAKGLAS